jgi:hypothetical protein
LASPYVSQFKSVPLFSLFSFHKLPNVTFFFSSITYLDITVKNFTLYGTWCICFKCKYKLVMGINEDNNVFFFSFYKLSNVTLFSLSITYLHITFKNLTLYGSRWIALSANGWKHTTPSVLSANKKVLILYFFLEKIWTSWFLGYMHMFFCQFWFLANLGLDHIFCKHPTNEGFRKFFCNLSYKKDFVLYNQISHYLLTILTIILEIMFGLSLIYMPSN